MPRDSAQLAGGRGAASTRRTAAAWLGVAALVALVALVALGACARPYGSEGTVELPATESSDTDAADSEGPSEEDDASTEDAPSDAEEDAGVDAGKDSGVDAGPCATKPNGHRWGTNDYDRCCGEKAVTLRTTSNCGACGIACAAGRTCVQESGHWLCKGCSTDAECRASVGPNATCYQSYCDCQGQCLGGAQCFVVTGHNYCSYP